VVSVILCCLLSSSNQTGSALLPFLKTTAMRAGVSLAMG